MQSSLKSPSPHRSKRQKKLKENSKGASSRSSVDSRWAEQYDTDVEKPCDGNHTTMEVGPEGADI
jgi:hypothetical protein